MQVLTAINLNNEPVTLPCSMVLGEEYGSCVENKIVLDLVNVFCAVYIADITAPSSQTEQRRVSVIAPISHENVQVWNNCKTLILKLFCSICNHPSGKKPTNYHLQFSGDFAYGFTKKAIDEMRKRGCTCVNRVWRPKDFNACMNELKGIDPTKEPYVETGYTKADMRNNLLKLFKILPEYYADTGKKLFGKRFPAMMLKQKNYIGFTDDLLFSYSCAIVPASGFEIEMDYTLVENGKIDSFDTVAALYPTATMARCGSLYRAFNGAFPLYHNLSSLIQLSICQYMGYKPPSRRTTNEAIFAL